MGDPLETDFWPIFGHFWPPGGGVPGARKRAILGPKIGPKIASRQPP